VAAKVSRPPAALEWAEAGRALPGEHVSGDLAVHLALGDRDLVAVIDGLGHGPEAAVAATRAREVIEEHSDLALDELLTRMHRDLRRTRGVVASLATVERSGHMRWVGVGNVETHLVRPDGLRLRLAGSAMLYGGVVGYRLPPVRVGHARMRVGDVLVMATDGITPDFVDGLPATTSLQHLVDTVLEQCAKPTDDALVAAARLAPEPGA
jgi:phosphoserine phosphatase RsbX